jgi:hypothetical protein
MEALANLTRFFFRRLEDLSKDMERMLEDHGEEGYEFLWAKSRAEECEVAFRKLESTAERLGIKW